MRVMLTDSVKRNAARGLVPREKPGADFGFLLLCCLLAGCSAPDGRSLYLPYVSDDVDASVSGGTGGMTEGAAAAGGTSANEGQGGSALGLGGSGDGPNREDSGAPPQDSGTLDAAGVDAAPVCNVSTEICDGLDNDCDDSVDPMGTCSPQCGGFALGERGYMYCREPLTRTQALGRCEMLGMHLAWLETPDENTALRAKIVATGLAAPPGNAEILTQIGGSDEGDEGAWSWVGNGAVAGGFQFWQGGSEDDGGAAVGAAYAAWATGEPSAMQNEDCAAVSVVGGAMRVAGAWDDRNCNEQLPFVCEAP